MHPKRTDSLPWREIDGHAVVVQPRRSEVHELNPVASLLWRLADGTRTLPELADAVAAEFDVPLERALEDTRAFFAELSSRELAFFSLPS
jgi:hypothetical protein